VQSFSLNELLWLSVGVEPSSISDQKLNDLEDRDPSDFWSPLAFLLRRRKQMKRRFIRATSRRHVSPREFPAWVDAVAFEAPEDFIKPLRANHEVHRAPSTR